jgi:hypothetical protein
MKDVADDDDDDDDRVDEDAKVCSKCADGRCNIPFFVSQ